MKTLAEIQESIRQLPSEERERLRHWMAQPPNLMVREPAVAYGASAAQQMAPGNFHAEAVPLRTDQDGAIRVGGTRVLLEVVIGAYERGDSPEGIVRAFPTLKLADVYAAIAYYLIHKDEVDAYIRQVERDGEEIRRKIEALPTYKPLTRETLRARLEEKKNR
jgi:uncharacterized protein (DUF433 family)